MTFWHTAPFHKTRTMFYTRQLLQHACRITLFSRDNCSLCTQAKSVLSSVWDKRPFEYREVNLARPDAEAWRALYDFDIPVVSLGRCAGRNGELNGERRFTSAKLVRKRKTSLVLAKQSSSCIDLLQNRSRLR